MSGTKKLIVGGIDLLVLDRRLLTLHHCFLSCCYLGTEEGMFKARDARVLHLVDDKIFHGLAWSLILAIEPSVVEVLILGVGLSESS